MIYFIQDSTRNYIKIGFTDGSPENRRKALQTGNSSGLTLLLETEGTMQDEKSLHQRFASSREIGEWFRPTPDLLLFIIEIARKPAVLQKPSEETIPDGKYTVVMDSASIMWEGPRKGFMLVMISTIDSGPYMGTKLDQHLSLGTRIGRSMIEADLSVLGIDDARKWDLDDQSTFTADLTKALSDLPGMRFLGDWGEKVPFHFRVLARLPTSTPSPLTPIVRAEHGLDVE